jgi:hypothetical protein
MMIGGFNSNYFSSFELHNWKTKKQCVLGYLPGLEVFIVFILLFI